eukprot:gnl/TRDRNA2_/TRDRNA2_165890_c1_seq1.p1 gnl/TRDRNA2_/TRDRNA2_165890_c1~~gnl/TRDRNA2_/TRDRNA2_165890_c1_seq1.p1  ORF type:complete len:108 (-),score=2.26 gnl/TRDRNA2_/TRDRNA2_165890_c1_seq1:17-340(-)
MTNLGSLPEFCDLSQGFSHGFTWNPGGSCWSFPIQWSVLFSVLAPMWDQFLCRKCIVMRSRCSLMYALALTVPGTQEVFFSGIRYEFAPWASLPSRASHSSAFVCGL